MGVYAFKKLKIFWENVENGESVTANKKVVFLIKKNQKKVSVKVESETIGCFSYIINDT